jgi:hypothetical protein
MILPTNDFASSLSGRVIGGQNHLEFTCDEQVWPLVATAK